MRTSAASTVTTLPRPGPAGLQGPPSSQPRVDAYVGRTLDDRYVIEKLLGEAIEPQAMSPAAFGKYIQADVARWTALVKAQNLHIDV